MNASLLVHQDNVQAQISTAVAYTSALHTTPAMVACSVAVLLGKCSESQDPSNFACVQPLSWYRHLSMHGRLTQQRASLPCCMICRVNLVDRCAGG